MAALTGQPAGSGTEKEVKWAKGLTQNARGDLWCMAFQIRGKRHALSLRCSQAEAAVAFDLGCYWAHAAKGNNPEGSTRYNFGVAWFPSTLLAELLALPDWEAVKASVTRMLALGMLRQLVPFEGTGRRYSVAPADGGRSQSGLELCVNARGVHFFRSSGWTCVPAEDVHSFGCRGPLVQLSYTPPPTGGPGRPKPATMVVLSCDTSGAAAELYLQLQQAAAQRIAAGLVAPRDLGAAIALAPGSGSAFGGSVQARPGRAGVAAAARADLLLSRDEYAEAAEEDSPAYSVQGSAALGAAATELEEDPSLEELALFTEFAELARSASGGGRECREASASGGGNRSESKAAHGSGGSGEA
ncbi:phosphoenolpyruvate carboxykinase [Chlorella sorokiniana]|uniref:Phosphoenolpyruvate carboxykinase n=1 Tax=Chlorella sorokiniana TaxID=3076 RepID=A0A2P6TV47_CHLSO|nr:phosphoenolpyruvate carboxykinase [Chlorella sorokiniana]|eukprot:PRW57928.1 phosphoenolpyruvate carboxykinase [Chlorella sorokiniana]